MRRGGVKAKLTLLIPNINAGITFGLERIPKPAVLLRYAKKSLGARLRDGNKE